MRQEILNALIQKGLRLHHQVHHDRAVEILNALIQKGLRLMVLRPHSVPRKY